MNAPRTTRSIDVQRVRQAWFAACRESCLSEYERRAIQKRITGKDSARTMTGQDFTRCLDDLKARGFWMSGPYQPKRAGSRLFAVDVQSAKMRALWLALYHFGEVRNPSEAALASFAQRMTGIAALQWLNERQASKVIEALKKWCAREGYEASGGGTAAKRRLLHALWAKLVQLGTMRISDPGAMDNWLRISGISCHNASITLLSDRQLDQVAEKLGVWVRRKKGDASVSW